ncbi:MAG: hypothetical protein JWL68_2201 [Actinomycetia bacterium]|nr:hypothetical protein [Actinomycetes bacterium]
MQSAFLRVETRPGRSVAAQLSEGELLRGQHHAGTKNASGHTNAIVGVVVIVLLILLVVVLVLAVG